MIEQHEVWYDESSKEKQKRGKQLIWYNSDVWVDKIWRLGIII